MDTVFEIGGEKFDVVKKGTAQARQIASAANWLSRYGTQAFREASKAGENMGGIETMITVLGALDENALLELFQITFGCSREIAAEEFDAALAIDGLISLYTNSPTVKKLADRFFSQASFESTDPSNSTQ